MSIIIAGLVVLGVSAVAAFPADLIISKPDPGPRYQYLPYSDGPPRLVDTWLKVSNVAAAARYSPDSGNGYHLFTRSNPQISQPLPLGYDSILRSSNFDSSKKTVLLVHGWGNTPQSNFNVHTTHTYLAAEDVNLIMTDWSLGADGEYITAMMNSIRSAEHVAGFLSWLISASGSRIEQIHIVGHSLGGQMAGIIGRSLGGKVPYITSLDPALPGWITSPHRFTPDAGVYTEVIHTDAGVSGLVNPAGDVDFYPNGGRNMPGCDGDRSCNHHRCVFYFTESLLGGGFTGRACDSLAAALGGNCAGAALKMGGTAPKTGSAGIFHVTTAATAPYSLG